MNDVIPSEIYKKMLDEIIEGYREVSVAYAYDHDRKDLEQTAPDEPVSRDFGFWKNLWTTLTAVKRKDDEDEITFIENRREALIKYVDAHPRSRIIQKPTDDEKAALKPLRG